MYIPNALGGVLGESEVEGGGGCDGWKILLYQSSENTETTVHMPLKLFILLTSIYAS